MTVLTIFMFERKLMQMPGPRDIVIFRPAPQAFSVLQKPWGWAHISVKKPRGARGGVVTGQLIPALHLRVFGLGYRAKTKPRSGKKLGV